MVGLYSSSELTMTRLSSAMADFDTAHCDDNSEHPMLLTRTLSEQSYLTRPVVLASVSESDVALKKLIQRFALVYQTQLLGG